jgi:hypothetical protein
METTAKKSTRKAAVKNVVTEDATQDFLNGKGMSTVKDFVFMEKTAQILNIGFQTEKNIVLYGPGGHGKSEIALSFFAEKAITPYVITMGTGMTTDRLFGGLDIQTFNATGKIEYLVENSFMNHEYVIFEEMFDAPDFILEQLKDILSSGIFRNGSQAYPIKTKFIVCATNRTREEFSKNMSLKALMERFPLELNVVWDNYTDIAYNTLLESKYGVGNVDPVIPFILQEYAKNSIIISPRVAVIAYGVFDQCGPDALGFIAEFAKKKSIIADALKKFEGMAKLREFADEIHSIYSELGINTLDTGISIKSFNASLDRLAAIQSELTHLKVTDDLAAKHADILKSLKENVTNYKKKAMIASTVEDMMSEESDNF